MVFGLSETLRPVGVSKDYPSIVKPNFNITKIDFTEIDIDTFLEKTMKSFDRKKISSIKKEQNKFQFEYIKESEVVIFNAFFIETKNGVYSLITMSDKKSYQIYKLIFKTIENSFRPYA